MSKVAESRVVYEEADDDDNAYRIVRQEAADGTAYVIEVPRTDALGQQYWQSIEKVYFSDTTREFRSTETRGSWLPRILVDVLCRYDHLQNPRP